MKIYHSVHQTAFSQRTMGFPIVLTDENGKVLGHQYSTKAECWWKDCPEQTAYAVLMYRTGTGRLEPRVFRVTSDGSIYRLVEADAPPFVEALRLQYL